MRERKDDIGRDDRADDRRLRHSACLEGRAHAGYLDDYYGHGGRRRGLCWDYIVDSSRRRHHSNRGWEYTDSNRGPQREAKLINSWSRDYAIGEHHKLRQYPVSYGRSDCGFVLCLHEHECPQYVVCCLHQHDEPEYATRRQAPANFLEYQPSLARPHLPFSARWVCGNGLHHHIR